jgi:hypothetical protein
MHIKIHNYSSIRYDNKDLDDQAQFLPFEPSTRQISTILFDATAEGSPHHCVSAGVILHIQINREKSESGFEPVTLRA